MVPTLFEANILEGEISYADLVLYPISPTHAMPHTYPMLDADPDMVDDEMEGDSALLCPVFTASSMSPLHLSQTSSLNTHLCYCRPPSP